MRHKHFLIFAIIAVSFSAGTSAPVVFGQQIVDDNVATPIERRVMLERTLTLTGVDYAVTVEHVLYDGNDLTRVYHYPHHKSEPLPRRRKFAIEVSLKPVGAADTAAWITFRTPATRFVLNRDVGFLVAPLVVGVGLRQSPDGDHLLIAHWNKTTNWSNCTIYAVSPDHRMASVPKVWHIDHMSSKRTPAVDDVWVFPQDPAYVTTIPLARLYYVDPDCRIFLTGDVDVIEVVRGAWGVDETKEYPPGTKTVDVAEYIIETHRHNLATGEATIHEPTPQQAALFDAVPRIAPPERIKPGDLPPHTHDQ